MLNTCETCAHWREDGWWADVHDEEPRYGTCEFPRNRLPKNLTDTSSMAFANAAPPQSDWSDCPMHEERS